MVQIKNIVYTCSMLQFTDVKWTLIVRLGKFIYPISEYPTLIFFSHAACILIR